MKKNSSNNTDLRENNIVFGRNPVIEALKSGMTADTLYICGDGGSLGMIRKLASEKGAVIKEVRGEKLDRLSGGGNHQGVVLEGACAEYVSVDDILEISRKNDKRAFIIICDGISDPHNLGAIIRTAETAGADGVIIPKRNSCGLNATVFKTSAGAVSYVPVARVPNLVSAIEYLKKNNVWIYGTDISGTDCYENDFTGNCAFVIGSEGKGISRLVKEKCDFLLKLPMYGNINSLNASVSAGIFMYETVRQRRISK